jgi:hypothetical protein
MLACITDRPAILAYRVVDRRAVLLDRCDLVGGARQRIAQPLWFLAQPSCIRPDLPRVAWDLALPGRLSSGRARYP